VRPCTGTDSVTNRNEYQEYDMIYLTAIGWPTGGSSSVHIYTQAIQRTTQNEQYIEQHKN